MSAEGERANKGIAKLVGTNDAANAVNFMESVDQQIKVNKLQRLMGASYKADDIADLEARYRDQKDRNRNFERLETLRKSLIAQINNTVPPPGPQDMITITYNQVITDLHDMEWKGRNIEEDREESRRKLWKQAEADHETLVASVAKVEQFIKERVESSVEMQIKDQIKAIEEPGERLRKMYKIVRSLIGGDQRKERHTMVRRLDDMPPAMSDLDCKEKINAIRVLRQNYRDSGTAEGMVIDMEEKVLIERLGEIALQNEVDFSAKYIFTQQSKVAGKTFEMVAAEMETALDKAIKKKTGENGGKGMGISSMQANAEQAIGMRAAGQNANPGGQGEKKKGDCYDWMEGKCNRGNNCWFQHDQNKWATVRNSRRERSPGQGRRGSAQGDRRSGGDRDRSRERERSSGSNDRGRERGSERRDTRKGGERERSRDRGRSESRSPDRSRDRGRSGDKDRDRSRTPPGVNGTPNKPHRKSGGGGGGRAY